MAGEPTTVSRFQPRGFVVRTALYAIGLYLGSIFCVSLITVAQKWAISTPKYWPYLLEWFRFWVWPVMKAELFRAPLTGLFYGLVGPLRYSWWRTVRFGGSCGLLAYGLGYFFSVLGARGPEWRNFITDWSLVQGSVLGVPLILILIARLRSR